MIDLDIEETVEYIDTRLIEVERVVDDMLERLTKLESKSIG